MAALVALSACSTAQVRTMPGADGTHKIVARDIERDGAESAANKAAHEYCEDRKKSAVFLSESTRYTGDMDESTRKTVRNASRAAQMIGMDQEHAAGNYGRPNTNPFSTAGSVGQQMTNDRDYEAEVKFQCR